MIFSDYQNYNGGTLLLGALGFTVQIYCDFAGYSLIAIGVAKIMGFELMKNFNTPYFSTSIQDFWRRWHISFIRLKIVFTIAPFNYFQQVEFFKKLFVNFRRVNTILQFTINRN
jgi:D-alanyl-lipoteichoic acid acyltransferase DltB (MBOAT superfamily)